MPVTIRDVAQAAGVSAPVVSTVLHGSKGNTRVSPATRQRVMEVAGRLGYRPHFASRSLARKRSETLGIFVSPTPGAGMGYEYEGSILQGVERACRELGYDILAINLGGQQTPDTCDHKFVEQRIDGLLLLHVEADADWVAPLCTRHPNVAAVNYYGDFRGMDILNYDNVAAGRLAARHLAALGHRRIGYLGWLLPKPGVGTAQRCQGLVEECRSLGLDTRPEWILDFPHPLFARPEADLPYELRFAQAARAMADLRPKGPTAWLAYNDMTAMRVCQQLAGLGLRVPQDLSVMGIDDAPSGQYFAPAIATVRQPFDEMGAEAVHRLVRRAEQGLGACPHAFLHSTPTLVARASAAPVPG